MYESKKYAGNTVLYLNIVLMNYEFKYGFIRCPTNNTLPLCPICQKFFQRRKLTFKPLSENIFSTASKKGDDGVCAFYNISLLIAQSGKPHTIGEEFIPPAISELVCTFH